MSGGRFHFNTRREEVPEGKHIAALYRVVEGRSQKGNAWVSLRFRLVQHNRESRDGAVYHPQCGAFLILYEGNEENVGIARDSLHLPRVAFSVAEKAESWKQAFGMPVLVDIAHRQYQDRDGKDRTAYDVIGMYPYTEDSDVFTPDILPGRVCIDPEWQEPPASKEEAKESGEEVPF